MLPGTAVAVAAAVARILLAAAAAAVAAAGRRKDSAQRAIRAGPAGRRAAAAAGAGRTAAAAAEFRINDGHKIASSKCGLSVDASVLSRVLVSRPVLEKKARPAVSSFHPLSHLSETSEHVK